MISHLYKFKIFILVITFFLFFSFLINPNYALGQEIKYEIKCNNYQAITISSSGEIISGVSDIDGMPESLRQSVEDTMRANIARWESLNEQDKQGILLILSDLGLSCSVNAIDVGTVKVDETSTSSLLKFKPEVGIPGFLEEQEVGEFLLGNFLAELYKYLIGLSGIVVVIILILGAFEWVLAGGDRNKIGKAKERIKNAFIGMILISCSYLILYTINPDLLNIVPIKIQNIEPIEVDRFELAASGSYTGSGYNIKSIGSSHIFSQEVIAGIQKSARWNNIDECIYYAVIHQESGGNPRAFGNDSAVTRGTACDIIARRAHICNLYPSCCPNWLAGRTTSNKSELCGNPSCSKYVYDKSISGVSVSNWKNYINKKGYTFGLGLGQITYHSQQNTLCDNNNGFYYQNKCFSFDSLLTVDSNLEAFVLGWKKQYCKDGQLELCFRRYAGGTTSRWAIDTGNLKLARYNKCKELGFENIATKGTGS